MTHLNKQLQAVSICKYIFSEELLISGIILQACKCCHSSPSLFCIGISHSHCKRLEMLNTATFLSVNMNMYSFFAFALSASPSLRPPSHPSLSVQLPNFCHFSFIFLAIVISRSHLSEFISVPTNTYCTEQAGMISGPQSIHTSSAHLFLDERD